MDAGHTQRSKTIISTHIYLSIYHISISLYIYTTINGCRAHTKIKDDHLDPKEEERHRRRQTQRDTREEEEGMAYKGSHSGEELHLSSVPSSPASQVYKKKKRFTFPILYLVFNLVVIPPTAKLFGREQLPIFSSNMLQYLI